MTADKPLDNPERKTEKKPGYVILPAVFFCNLALFNFVSYLFSSTPFLSHDEAHVPFYSLVTFLLSVLISFILLFTNLLRLKSGASFWILLVEISILLMIGQFSRFTLILSVWLLLNALTIITIQYLERKTEK